MSQLPFSGMSGFFIVTWTLHRRGKKSIFAFRVKLKGSFLHSKLTKLAGES